MFFYQGSIEFLSLFFLTFLKLQLNFQRKSAEDAYIASIHEADDGTGKLIVIAGSNVRTGECLRALTINGNESGSKLNPFCLLSGNKQIVRTSWYSPKVILHQEYHHICLTSFFILRIKYL